MTVKLLPLRTTDALVRDLQLEHSKDDGIRTIFGVSGSACDWTPIRPRSGENIGKLTVVMADGGSKEDQRHDRAACAVRWRRLQRRPTSPAPSCSVFRRRLRANPHYADVKSTVEQGFPEIQIRFDQDAPVRSV